MTVRRLIDRGNSDCAKEPRRPFGTSFRASNSLPDRPWKRDKRREFKNLEHDLMIPGRSWGQMTVKLDGVQPLRRVRMAAKSGRSADCALSGAGNLLSSQTVRKFPLQSTGCHLAAFQGRGRRKAGQPGGHYPLGAEAHHNAAFGLTGKRARICPQRPPPLPIRNRDKSCSWLEIVKESRITDTNCWSEVANSILPQAAFASPSDACTVYKPVDDRWTTPRRCRPLVCDATRRAAAMEPLVLTGRQRRQATLEDSVSCCQGASCIEVIHTRVAQQQAVNNWLFDLSTGRRQHPARQGKAASETTLSRQPARRTGCTRY